MAEQLESVSATFEIELPHNFAREAHCSEQRDAHAEREIHYHTRAVPLILYLSLPEDLEGSERSNVSLVQRLH